MKVSEINENQANAETKLLRLMDQIFGIHSNGSSRYRRVKQVFDEQSGEHVIYLEYRTQAKNQSPIIHRKTHVKPADDKTKATKKK